MEKTHPGKALLAAHHMAQNKMPKGLANHHLEQFWKK